MPADEVILGTDVDGSRERTRARHAAPKKPLFTRFHMPAGKAIASVAMPTAVLVGLGFTSSLALADNGGTTPSAAKSQQADEYKDCVQALADGKKADDGKDGKDPSASPSPSASGTGKDDAGDKGGTKDTGTKDTGSKGTGTKDSGTDAGKPSSSDSGSDDTAKPDPTRSTGTGTSVPTPSTSASPSGDGGLLGGLGDTVGNVLGGTLGTALGGGTKDSGTTTSPTPSQSATKAPEAPKTPESKTPESKTPESKKADAKGHGTLTGTVKDTLDKVTGTVKDTTDGASRTVGDAGKALGDAGKAAKDAVPGADAALPDDCPKATDAEGGIDNKVPLADDPWYLSASSLTLKGADYKGIVEVRTANGTVKKVLKYVISDGTDIGDLHQTVIDKQAGKTYHVQAGKGTTSTITGGQTVMYTEKISGNLLGLLPVTFSPDSPPPLNLPLIYFTNAKVTQAAQFGGNLHIPGMRQYITD
ncbi:hypothetical protein KUM39_02845 [Streptomyces sp. J2-1]|uniref:hypothetical protein n=1 Tax=Streptomyces corallincola TaxID=2851888 RepID=UPI001C38C456|nr:hypothetical protein [Streptomyces corallincola]MBV2353308.1 hypothetical protein [Streptomyces corallincola]